MKYILYFFISTFRGMGALPVIAVFCSFLISCFLGALLRHCLSDFEIIIIICIIVSCHRPPLPFLNQR